MVKLRPEIFEELGKKLIPPTPPPPPKRKKGGRDEGWAPLLTPKQQEAFDSAARYILTYGEKGSGKCVSPESQVYTSDGLMRIRRMADKTAGTVGMNDLWASVIAWDGRATRTSIASHLWIDPHREAKRATFSHGGELIGSHRHPIWVCRSDGTFGWEKLSEIDRRRKLGERFWTPLLAHPSFNRTKLVSVSVASKIRGKIAADIQIEHKLAYALGALCGDGSLNISTGDYRALGFTNIDTECIDGVREGVGLLGATLTRTGDNQFNVVGSPTLRLLIAALGMDCTAHFKRIPDAILESPKHVLSAFLRGLFDTDGTVEKAGTVQLTTVSDELSLDVQRALQAIGILSVRRRKKTVTGGAWNISIMGKWSRVFGREIGFRISRKQARIRPAVESALCPRGENHNRYGLPAPICTALREVWRTFVAKEERTREWHDRHRKFSSIFKGCIPSADKVREMLMLCGSESAADDYLVSDNWVEITDVTDCESRLIDLSVPGLSSFLANGHIHHNTIGLLHKMVRHCYENENALGLILVRVKSMATKGGAWDKLIGHILPRWKDGNRDETGALVDEGLGIEFSDVKFDSQHNEYIWVENRFGGWSMIVLVSAPHANQLRDRMRGYEPSIALVDELTSCDSIEYLRAVAIQIGRREGIAGPQQYMAACNPEGPSHWVHKVWFEEAFDPVTGVWDPDYHKIHVPISDNRKNLPPGYVENLEKLYRNDPIEAARMLRGEWIDRPSGDSLFKDIWVLTMHVRPPLPTMDRLMPDGNYPMIVGMDPGSANNSFSFMQWLPVEEEMKWVVFDEMVYTQRRLRYDVLVTAFLRRIKFWNDTVFAGTDKRFRVVYNSDNSAFNQFRAAGGSFDVLDFERFANEPKNGRPPLHKQLGLARMKVVPAPKFNGSVRTRTRLVMDLLGANQLIVSAGCPKHIEMFNHLESEPQKPNSTFDPDLAMTPRRSNHLHVYDSMCNPILTAAISPQLLTPQAEGTQQMFGIGS